MIGKQIHNWKIPQLPVLPSHQGTKLTWARIIDCYDHIPDVYKEFFGSSLQKNQPFPYSVLTPAYQAPGFRITEKMVCLFDHELHILERSGSSLDTQCYPLAGITYVKVSSMLLDSRIRVNGITSQEIPASSIVRFSTATDYIFKPILEKIRLYPSASDSSINDSEAFDHWMHLNYKFMNLARNSLLEGEKVICAVLQAEVRKDLFTILGKTYFRTISPTHASILTDHELILIREEVLQGRDDKYGGIWEFIPLSKIADLSISRKSEHLLILSVQLRTNGHLECLFQSSKKYELDRFLDAFGKLKSK
jgi:hypothetical protein